MHKKDPTPAFARSIPKHLLTGLWNFAVDDDDVGLEECWYKTDKLYSTPQAIIVPYSPETAASDVADPRQHNIVWYKKTIKWDTVSPHSRGASPNSRRYFLHFEAVDYECIVWVQGRMVGSHVGGQTPFSFEITEHVRDLHKLSDDRKLVVVVRAKDSAQDMSQPRGKQYWKQDSYGECKPESIFYTPTTGIWQDVWMEARPINHLRSAHFVSDIDAGTVRADVEVDLQDPGCLTRKKSNSEHWVSFTVRLGGKVISSCKTLVSPQTQSCSTVINVRQAGVQPEGSLRARLTTPGVLPPEVNRDRWDNGLALWSPESPTLYDVEIRLLDEKDTSVDLVHSYFGMRKVSIDDQGRFCLNNRVYFQKLILNQGYWLDCGLSAPSYDTFADEIKQIKQMGFNGVRMHQKVESQQFLCEADRLGLLVWGEMANAYEFSSSYIERFTKEWIDVVRRDMSHPCIVAWVPINESWGVPSLNTSAQQRSHLLSLYHLTKALDPTRPVIDNDGWQHVETDFITVHDYRSAPELEAGFSTRAAALSERVTGYPILLSPLSTSEKRHTLPILCTEFGGLALRVDNVATTANGVEWGYANASSQQDFLSQFEALVKALTKTGPDGNRVVQGFCYTQFTDVEQEVNGLLTRDRKFKVAPEKIKAILDAI
ncbi:uncharacterized protein UTRI_01554_B [Ustilago trichophora]|uniref:Glycoside hydrolase family 2 protein n=1 Tax=Ustilago trichophora TaxID=86804 RepID=A0A5C3E3C3_9BASI|nr:uncharacterized protein UTRI_01554_B [Ustilago trichophora]